MMLIGEMGVWVRTHHLRCPLLASTIPSTGMLFLQIYTLLSTNFKWHWKRTFSKLSRLQKCSTGDPFKHGQWGKTNIGGSPFAWFPPLFGNIDLAALAKFRKLGPESPPVQLLLWQFIPSLCSMFLHGPYHYLKLQYTFICLLFTVCLPHQNVHSMRAGMSICLSISQCL